MRTPTPPVRAVRPALLFLPMISLLVHITYLSAQVVIREKVEIEKSGVNQPLGSSTVSQSSTVSYFDPPVFALFPNSITTPLPALLNVRGEIDRAPQRSNTWVQLRFFGGSTPGGQGKVVRMMGISNNIPYDISDPFDGIVGKQSLWATMLVRDLANTRDYVPQHYPQRYGSANEARFEFLGQLAGLSGLIDIPARVIATGSILDEERLDGWQLEASKKNLLCSYAPDSVSVVTFISQNAKGETYAPTRIPGAEAWVSLKVESKRDYVTLREPDQGVVGREIIIRMHNLWSDEYAPLGRVRLVYNAKAAAVPEGIDTVRVAINGGGKSASTTVLICCDVSYFEVMTAKDTVEHGSTIALTTIARDYFKREISLKESRMLKFSVPEGSGCFIVAGRDTVPDEAVVPYALARKGEIQFWANGNVPATSEPEKLRILAQTIEEPRYGSVSIVIKKEALDHFRITFRSDTTAFAETNEIFVQAKDKDSNDVALDGSKLLGFEVETNAEFATFVDRQGDTVKVSPAILRDVRYQDANDGLIRLAAVKKNPDSVVVCRLRVALQEDENKMGRKDAIVVEQTLKIVMEGERVVEPIISPRTIQKPGKENKKEFTVRLTRGGKPIENHPFGLTTDYVDSSGGHSHVTPRRTEKRENDGHFILRRTGTDYDRPYNGSTQSNGEERFDYVASIFGDIMRVRVDSRMNQLLWDTLSVVERVPGLIRLPASPSYVRVGGTCNHHGPSDKLAANSPCQTPDNNHWGERKVIEALFFISGAWKVNFPNESILVINDISLPNGGLFDVKGNWQPEHSSHRNGRDVDVRTELPNEREGIPVRNEGGLTVPNRGFEKICRGRGATAKIHERGTALEHYHIDF